MKPYLYTSPSHSHEYYRSVEYNFYHKVGATTRQATGEYVVSPFIKFRTFSDKYSTLIEGDLYNPAAPLIRIEDKMNKSVKMPINTLHHNLIHYFPFYNTRESNIIMDYLKTFKGKKVKNYPLTILLTKAGITFNFFAIPFSSDIFKYLKKCDEIIRPRNQNHVELLTNHSFYYLETQMCFPRKSLNQLKHLVKPLVKVPFNQSHEYQNLKL